MPTPEETWFREFAAHSDDALWLQEPPGTVVYVSPAFETLFGVCVPHGFKHEDWAAMVHPDDRARAMEALPRSVMGEVISIDYRIIRPNDGAIRWIRDKGFPVFSPDGTVRGIAGIARDVTEEVATQQALAESEARARTLLAELQHRVRNTLGVVRSIVRRTAEQARDVQGFAYHLDGRLAAFARVQAMVTRQPDAGILLSEIVDDELLAHAVQPDGSVHVEGDAARLPAALAERLSLAVHELATNSVKHGILGKDGGRLDVRWRLGDGQDGPLLSFSWTETGLGRPLRKPRRTGFGTELLTRTLAYELKAKSAMHFGKAGFSYTLFVPLPRS